MAASELVGVDGAARSMQGTNAGAQYTAALLGRYSGISQRGRVFAAHSLTAADLVALTTEAGQQMILRNPPGSNVDVSVLGIGWAVTVVSTAVGGFGLVGRRSAAAPTTQTAIDRVASLRVGGSAPSAETYEVGSFATDEAELFFVALAHATTGAITIETGDGFNYCDLGGIVTCPPGTAVSIAGTAALTAFRAHFTIVWEETPLT